MDVLREIQKFLYQVNRSGRQTGRTTMLAKLAKKQGAMFLTHVEEMAKDMHKKFGFERRMTGSFFSNVDIGYHGPIMHDHLVAEMLLSHAATEIAKLMDENRALKEEMAKPTFADILSTIHPDIRDDVRRMYIDHVKQYPDEADPLMQGSGTFLSSHGGLASTRKESAHPAMKRMATATEELQRRAVTCGNCGGLLAPPFDKCEYCGARVEIAPGQTIEQATVKFLDYLTYKVDSIMEGKKKRKR